MNITRLNILTGGWQTSSLFTSVIVVLSLGLPRNNSSQVVRAGLNARPLADFKAGALITRQRCLSLTGKKELLIIAQYDNAKSYIGINTSAFWA